MPSSAQAGFKLILLPISPTNCVGVGLSWAELSSVLSLGVGWVNVEIKAISAQPTEVGVGLSWAELGNYHPPPPPTPG